MYWWQFLSITIFICVLAGFFKCEIEELKSEAAKKNLEILISMRDVKRDTKRIYNNMR